MTSKPTDEKKEPKLPEGRHIAGPDAADKLDRNFKKYRQSDKGKAAYKRYQSSEKGKEVKKRYFQSPKGKEALKRWLESDKGKDYMANKKLQKKIFAAAKKIQDEKPSLSPSECLIEAEWLIATEVLDEEEINV